MSTSVFKAITGGDLVPAEKKHGELYEYLPFCRLLFSANQPPQSRDASRAFFRRWFVVPFEATFTAEQRLPETVIDAMMADPEQLSGALNRALDALERVRGEGITETDSMRQAWLEFRQVTDPVTVWLDSNTVEEADIFVVKGDLVRGYNAAAREHGWPVLTDGQFARRVKEWRPQIQDGQKRVGGDRPTVWYGIGLKVTEKAV